VLGKGAVSKSAQIPLWVMMVGAIGICLGLALFGPKLIRTVGSEITELDQTRAFCIAMSATITVIIASQLGLPVSSTHIAVGGVFGVGFLREYLDSSYARMVDDILAHHPRRCRADQGLPAPLRPGDAAGKGCHARPAEA
jgi:PiT family inorganic phosphate transporter